MDGRWKWALAGFVGGVVGCQTPQARQSAELAKQTDATAKMVKAQQLAAAAQEPLPARDHRLKSETMVKLGALKEQAADDADRPQVERDAFRYQARQSYQKAIDQDPKCTMAYIALAGSYVQTSEFEKAFGVFDKAVKKNPNNATLWFELGSVHARMKDWTAALECLAQATQLDPENKHFQKTYGLALARMGRYDEGCAILASCMSEAEARYNIARMQKHLGQLEASQQQLQLAIQANPNFLPAQELLAEISGAAPAKPVNFEEAPKPAAPPPSSDPKNLPPVLIGNAPPPPKPSAKIRFDATQN